MKTKGSKNTSLHNLPTVILCGGESLRFRNASYDAPKTLAPIGKQPILVHILDRFRRFGISRFIVCVRDSDTEIAAFFEDNPEHAVGVEVISTGENVPTGARLKAIEQLISCNQFLMSYGDFLTDVDLDVFWETHLKGAVVSTILAVNPNSAYGILKFDPDGYVSDFQEKPKLQHWVNAGLFIFQKRVFEYLHENTVLETEGLSLLIEAHELQAYQHVGYWQSMDTPKEHRLLNEIWESGNVPWLR